MNQRSRNTLQVETQCLLASLKSDDLCHVGKTPGRIGEQVGIENMTQVDASKRSSAATARPIRAIASARTASDVAVEMRK